MRAFILTALLGAIVGCGGSEKELPRDLSISTDRDADSEAALPVPKESEPEAVKLIEKCLAAATEGHPERLDRVKICHQVVRGSWRWQNDLISGAVRDSKLAWPDRARIALDFESGPFKQFLFLCRGGQVEAFQNEGMGLNPAPTGKDTTDNVRFELMGEIWLPSLVPLRDPKTIVFGLKEERYGSKTANTVKVAIPDHPVYTLWFDKNVELPGMVSYSHLEQGLRVSKFLVMDAYKAFDGVKLPTDLEERRGIVSAQTWTVQTWEFPARFDNSVFEQAPK